MSEFAYKGWNTEGESVQGHLEAPSKQELESLLYTKGILLSNASQVRVSNGLVWSKATSVIALDELLELCNELTVLIKAGLTISEALVLMQETDDESEQTLTNPLKKITESVLAGVAVSKAFSESKIFDPVFVSTLKTGEQSGDLLTPLTAYKTYIERKLELKKKVQQAMTYPLFLMITFGIILALMFVFVVPNFIGLNEDIDVELPWLTMQLLATVDRLPLIMATLMTLVFSWYAMIAASKRNEQFKLWLDKLKWRTPLIGYGVRMMNYWQLTKSLASMTNGGTSLIKAMEIACGNTANGFFAHQLAAMTNRMKNGESFHQSISQELDLPKRQLKMLEIGEASSQLADMLESVADYFETKLDARVKRISKSYDGLVVHYLFRYKTGALIHLLIYSV